MLYKENKVIAASYSRLSREDGDKIESDSIRNQKELIADYALQKGIEIVEEYVDDGYSGTTFERPAFQRMMEEMKAGRMNCILVKDLSRLGRNYIETGKYLEKVFPFLNIRFVAINDHYDSAEQGSDSEQIVIPFKNLINDAYCRDISIKIRSQLDVKRKNGKFIGSFAAYGYRKDPQDKNHLVVDETAAKIVRAIFGLKLSGYSSQRIVEHLDKKEVASPLEYKRMSGLNFNSGFRSGRKPHWSVMTINRILKNELYIGTMVQGKNRKINYKVRQSVPIEEADWIRVQETHKGIISKQVFDIVQRLAELDTRTAPESENVYLLSGFLRCGSCGQNMVRRTATKNEKKYVYYHCSTFKRGEGCTSHNISEEKLMKQVLNIVRRQIELVAVADVSTASAGHGVEKESALQTLHLQIATVQKEIERYGDLKAKVYQDMQDGVVSREEFKEINMSFTEKMNTAKATREELERKRENISARDRPTYPWIDLFKGYKNVDNLERKMLAFIIDHIVVYEAGGIEVHFRHEDEIREMQLLTDTLTCGKKDTVGGRAV